MEFTTGWHANHIERWSRWLAHLKDAECSAVEVGSWEGASAVWLMQNILTHPNSRLICIDPHSYAPGKASGKVQQVRRRFMENTREWRESGRLVYVQEPSVVALRRLPYLADLHFAYIDGMHWADAVLTDAFLLWPLLRVGGRLVFDDYLWKRKNDTRPAAAPAMGIDAFKSVFQLRCKVIEPVSWQVCLEKTERGVWDEDRAVPDSGK